jgi:hypothetical protein
MKTKIDRFKEEVNKLKKILDYVIENIYNYYNIIINIYNTFELKKRNYEILCNIKEINNNDIYGDFNKIINEDNILIKFFKINLIYNKMKNDSQKNMANNTNNNLSNYLNISPNENGLNRICQEYDECKSLSSVGHCFNIGFKLFPLNNNNPYEWTFSLNGLNYTPYSGGKYYIKILFPSEYPKRAPEFYFVTPFYHLNVNPYRPKKGDVEHLGHITLVILKKLIIMVFMKILIIL